MLGNAGAWGQTLAMGCWSCSPKRPAMHEACDCHLLHAGARPYSRAYLPTIQSGLPRLLPPWDLSAATHLQLTCLYEVGPLAYSHFGLQSYGSHARLNLRPGVLVSCLLQLCLRSPLLPIMTYILSLLVADRAEGSGARTRRILREGRGFELLGLAPQSVGLSVASEELQAGTHACVPHVTHSLAGECSGM